MLQIKNKTLRIYYFLLISDNLMQGKYIVIKKKKIMFMRTKKAKAKPQTIFPYIYICW